MITWDVKPSPVGEGYYDYFLRQDGRSLGVPFLIEPYMLLDEPRMRDALHDLTEWFNKLLANRTDKGDTPIMRFKSLVDNRLVFDGDKFYVQDAQ
jgi:hypothetical protein